MNQSFLFTLLSVLTIVCYGCLSVFVCRHQTLHSGKCGLGKSFLMPLLMLFLLFSLCSPWRFLLTGRPVPGTDAAALFPRSGVWLLVTLGLLAGGAGDTLLEIGDRYFAGGLVSFLIGHFFYLAASLLQIADGGAFRPWILLLLAGYLPVILTVGRRIVGGVSGPIRTAVTIYLTAILAMSMSAACRLFSVPAAAYVSGLAGSILFIVSDSILAENTFLGAGKKGVMPTYTLAQALLTVGFLLAM